ncbi:MAG TPA: sigma-E factor negative regulatory protein [Steroidobacteraceae bacterium]|nr:sigma-E factor negative regulatory protein [Steroidobacteraceae bacterium]
MNKEELESQLSAMFDDELPAPECELLARRLARDEQLRERWGRYAAIGACVRGEPGVRLQGALACKVSAALKQESPQTGLPIAEHRRRGLSPWMTSLGGLASAAAVAAVAILWMRSESPALVAHNTPVQNPVTQQPVVQAVPAPTPQLASTQPVTSVRQSHEPDSYIVPAAVSQGPALVEPTELANYIVAHSAYSGPLMRRNAISALLAGDSAAPQVTAQPIPATVVTGK